MIATPGVSVAKKVDKKDRPVRLSDAAIQLARIASGYTGESMAEYVSRVVAERARLDINDLHARLEADLPADAPPADSAPRPKKPGPK